MPGAYGGASPVASTPPRGAPAPGRSRSRSTAAATDHPRAARSMVAPPIASPASPAGTFNLGGRFWAEARGEPDLVRARLASHDHAQGGGSPGPSPRGGSRPPLDRRWSVEEHPWRIRVLLHVPRPGVEHSESVPPPGRLRTGARARRTATRRACARAGACAAPASSRMVIQDRRRDARPPADLVDRSAVVAALGEHARRRRARSPRGAPRRVSRFRGALGGHPDNLALLGSEGDCSLSGPRRDARARGSRRCALRVGAARDRVVLLPAGRGPGHQTSKSAPRSSSRLSLYAARSLDPSTAATHSPSSR